jgi:hypothetical protein
VRYVAMGEVNQIRLQVFSVDGREVFDSALRLGNLIDWQLMDQQGASLADGSYLFLVTVKDFSANLTQKYGTAVLESEQVYLEQTSRGELPAPQATALEANQQAEALSAVDRIGAAGSNPTSTASTDAPTVRDGAPTGKETATSPTVTGGENATGAGSQNKIAKWTDNAGTLGDSTITESSDGKIGVGADPVGSIKLNISSAFGTIPFGFTQNAPASAFPTLALFSTSDGAVGQYAATTHNGAVTFLMGATASRNFGLFANNSYNAPNLFIKNDGNVGIGTTTPSSKLVVETGGSGGVVHLGTPNGETGMGIIGANRADIRFDGSQLKLVAGLGPGPPPSTNGITVKTSGDVTIGGPQLASSRLHVNGGNGTGVFAQSDSTSLEETEFYLTSAAVRGYNRMGGWAGFFTGPVKVTGTFSNNSDRNTKANITSIDPRTILRKLTTVPIQAWNYTAEGASIRHVGPMAQDFRAAFGLGIDEKGISTVDADGVALASIQALYQLMLEKEKKNERQSSQIHQQGRQIAQLQAQLNQVKRSVRRRAAKR